MRWVPSVLLVAAMGGLAFAACGVPEFDFGTGSGGSDASVGGGGSGGTGGSAGSATGGVGATGGAAGGAGDAATDAPTGCKSDTDCSAPTPHCNTVAGQCVKCLPSDDDCPAGQYCASTFLCQVGCKSAAECNAFPDASGVLVCESHKCKGCQVDDDCPSGKICNTTTTECVPGCTTQHPCEAGQDCCSGSCAVTAVDVNNCGTCGNACPANPPNAKPACKSGKCTLSCDFSMADCNGDPVDGCEINLFTDAKHCGDCQVQCASGQTCKNKICS